MTCAEIIPFSKCRMETCLTFALAPATESFPIAHRTGGDSNFENLKIASAPDTGSPRMPVKRVLGKQTKMLPNAKDDEQKASQAKPNPKNGYTN
ncbi:hypothetical protein C8F04DRAFT_1266353 [Mycena alexandri]|uniref:Uncharacterized protein n=1 Tax=Mycena alexandri TaxID=1745969 RepID=A0AAD6SIA0_9AGAR|nr:hypothetical protein C8F04DRAFT_1266353 [Mycena alexandri]